MTDLEKLKAAAEKGNVSLFFLHHDNGPAFVLELLAELEAAREWKRDGEWIDVHDRLPELTPENEDEGVEVWTWDGMSVARDLFAPEYEQPAGPAVGGWVRVGDWFSGDPSARVTHWMKAETPAPPCIDSAILAEGSGK